MATKKDTTAVATTHDYSKFAGQGFEELTQDDFVLPYMTQLQALSPEIAGDDPVDGARPGDFYNTGTQELIQGPLNFIVCSVKKCYVEWVPRKEGGGFVGVHEVGSDVVTNARAAGQRINLKTPAGNDLVETAYMFCLGLDEKSEEVTSPFIFSMTITKLKPYRSLMTRMRTVKGSPPIYAFRWTATPIGEKNKQGQPYKNVSFSPALGTIDASLLAPNSALFEAAVEFAQQVQSGDAKVDHAKAQSSASDMEDVPFA